MTLEFLGDCKIYTGCPVFPLIYDWKKGLNHVIGIFFLFPVLRCALRALNFAILRGFTWILGGLHSHSCNFPFTWKCISFRLSCCTSIPGFFPLWYYCHTVIFFFCYFSVPTLAKTEVHYCYCGKWLLWTWGFLS